MNNLIELEDIVNKIKQNNIESFNRLYIYYKEEINMFIELLKYNKVHKYLNKQLIYRFILLFIPSKYKKHINSYKYNINSLYIIENIVETLNIYFSKVSEEDIFNVLYYTFIELAKKYNKLDKFTFHIYIDRYYHIYLKKRLDQNFKDYFKYEINHEIDNIDLYYNNIIDSIEYNISYKNDFTNNLDILWIIKGTCNPIFKNLEYYERKLLYDHYILRKNDSVLAKELGFKSRHSILRKRKNIKNKIISNIKKYNLYVLWK